MFFNPGHHSNGLTSICIKTGFIVLATAAYCGQGDLKKEGLKQQEITVQDKNIRGKFND